MRKAVLFVLSALLCLCLALVPQAPARAQHISIYVDGKRVTSDVPPYIKNGRVMVPLRFVAEAFAFNVVWAGESAADPIQIYPVLPGVNSQLRGVADDFGYFALQPGSNSVFFKSRKLVDNGTVTTGNFSTQPVAAGDVPAEIQNGRTFVPLRLVAELLGCRVEWDEAAWAVRVSRYDPEKIISYHPQLRVHYRQDLYPGELYYRRDGDNIKLSLPVLVRSGGPESSLPIVENVEVAFYLDGREAGRAIQELAFDRDFTGSLSASAAVVVRWPKGESHTVKVVVDPDGKHWDRNRANNTLVKTITLY